MSKLNNLIYSEIKIDIEVLGIVPGRSTDLFEGFLGDSVVKSLPAVQETQVQSLGLEDPLEKEMATLSSILAWKIPWTEEPGRLQSMESQGFGHNLYLLVQLLFLRLLVKISLIYNGFSSSHVWFFW